VVADGDLTPKVAKLREQISPRIERGSYPSNGGSQTNTGRLVTVDCKDPRKKSNERVAVCPRGLR